MDQRQLQKQYDAFVRAPRYAPDSGAELFCVCRKEDNGDLMVACDGCDEWYHFKCMKLDLKWKNLVKSYQCPFCCVLKSHGKPLWKRKCRLQDCFSPIGDQSSFCSPAHGELYWKRVISRFENTSAVDYDQNERVYPGELNMLMSVMTSRDQLIDLGGELPPPPSNTVSIDPLVDECNTKIANLSQKRDKLALKKSTLDAKLTYILKLKDRITEINSIMNNSNQAQQADEDLPAVKPKKKKSKLKNTSKFDVCGYDAHFDIEDWLEFVQSDEYRNFIESSIDNESIVKKEYNAVMKREEGSSPMDQDLTSLKWVCLNDKRKCIHSNWFTIERDDVKSKIDIIVNSLESIDVEIKELNKLITVQKWEQLV